MASISLTKGQNISLTKEAPNLKNALIGLGWDANGFDGNDFDLDASAIMLGANGVVRTPDDFIFYGKLESNCGAIKHTGDNTTGEGDGDDEEVIVDLTKVPSDVQKIVFPVSIYAARGP
jgi:tellurium resistance protein TerD